MTSAKELPLYDYKGWLIKRHPNSFAEKFQWSANLINVSGYREEYHGFNTERECKKFIDMVEE
jgi:hypothetical protein